MPIAFHFSLAISLLCCFDQWQTELVAFSARFRTGIKRCATSLTMQFVDRSSSLRVGDCVDDYSLAYHLEQFLSAAVFFNNVDTASPTT